MSMIQQLRENLTETLRAVGPGEPTLCEGWRTEHLLAHLLLRETRPDVAAGVVLPPLAGRTERLTRQLAERLADPAAYAEALEKFRSARTLARRSEKADTSMNLIEYVVHREDVLRASEAGARAAEDLVPFRPDEESLVWDALASRAGMFAARYPGGLELVGLDADGGAPAFGPVTARRPTDESFVSRAVQAVVRAENPGARTTLVGTPVDLVLHLFGRGGAAQVRSTTSPAREG